MFSRFFDSSQRWFQAKGVENARTAVTADIKTSCPAGSAKIATDLWARSIARVRKQKVCLEELRCVAAELVVAYICQFEADRRSS